MKRIGCFLLCWALWSIAIAQNFGNEWINYSQTYYRIPVTQKGILRIGLSDLNKWGISVGSFQPQNLQVFYKGKEQYIYIDGEADGVFNSADYIEFFAEGNNAWLDSALYENGNEVPNPEWSMVTDTASYFLTWNKSQNNRRIKNLASDAYALAESQPFCLFTTSTEPLLTQSITVTDNGPFLSAGEGWCDNYFSPGTSKTISLNTPHFVQSTQKSIVKIGMISSKGSIHSLRFNFLDIDSSMVFYDASMNHFRFQTNSNLAASTSVTAINLSASKLSDYNAFTYAKISYPRSFDCDKSQTFSCFIPRRHEGDQTALEVSNFDGNEEMLVYDTTHHVRTKAIYENNKYHVLLPNPVQSSFVFMSAAAKIASPVQIVALPRFIDYSTASNQGNYLIISHSSLWSKAQEYAQYRKQMGFKPLLVDVEQLYDQFGYGVKNHPIAIKNFCRYALFNWKQLPEYLFIIGKGVDLQYCRKNSAAFKQNLVPVIGWPGTDNLYTFGLSGATNSMRMATGRLSAKTSDDVDLYLRKVKEYEANTDVADWKKHILHFSGGGNIAEQTSFKTYLSQYEAIWRDTLYGGSVLTFSKNSSDPIEITKTDLIKQEINNGVSFLLFFGHAAATGFDQNIDLPSSYQNKGRYPLLIANSCYNGNIYLTGEPSISEQWVLIRDKGMIGFLANVDLGLPFYLNRYTSLLCRNIAYRNYGQPFGISIKNTIKQAIDSIPGNELMRASALDMTFHGDPALKPYSFAKPDLSVTTAALSFQPEVISSDVDSFRVSVAISNLGRAVVDTFVVRVQRWLPDNSEMTISKKLPALYYKDTVVVSFPTRGFLGVGINRLSVTVDATNHIDELNESNNTVSTDLFISSYDMIPVYPTEFAIYPFATVQLMASNANAKTDKLRVMFEIDTTKSFSSSFKLSAEIDNETGLASWTVPATLKPYTVYYWRVSNIKKNKSESNNWSVSSFIYIPQKTGWGQSRFDQFDKNATTYINYNTTKQQYDFITTPKKLQCKVQGLASNVADWRLVQYTIDGSLQAWSGCQFESALQVAVIDPVSLKPWTSNRANYGQKNYPICGASNELNNFFGFSANTTGIAAMTKFLRDSVPTGYYVLIYTFYSGQFDQWSESALQTLVDFGSKSIRSVPNNYPYIFFAQKGKPATAQERIGKMERDIINLEVDLPTNYSEGWLHSTNIGPATNWRSFAWKTAASDGAQDSAIVSLWGINPQGKSVLLKSNIQRFDTLSLTDISAAQYPYLQLGVRFKDPLNHTPNQLRFWHVYFDPVPETAVILNKDYLFHKDTLDQGDVMRLHLVTQNISSVDMDSLRVKYVIRNQDNAIVLDQQHIIPAHKAGTTAVDSIQFNTNNVSGKFTTIAEFNPKNQQTGNYYQLEQLHFNNIYQKQFFVQADKINPLLDVTFDGVHILNGDIVSAKPEINIALLDNNKFHALDDTSLFEVYLRPHGGSVSQRVYFMKQGLEQMRFIPAQTGKNKASIVYKPTFEKDGKYELSVKAHDKAGNQSGSNNYSITFEVVIASSITNLLNYPNPFSTSTRFVFTLTGSSIPTDLRIQILTVTGHLVREIGIEELGSLHIGRNITPYAWDGTDMFGDKLANGVYYYRVFSRIGNEAINNRATEADKFFTKGYGKMYIMR